MARTKLYAAIYVVLFVLATVQVGVEQAGWLGHETYWWAFSAILLLSLVKAVVVAGYYQHLRWEPRSISVLITIGLLAALALSAAASASIM